MPAYSKHQEKCRNAKLNRLNCIIVPLLAANVMQSLFATVMGLDSRRDLRALVGRVSDAPSARHSLTLPFESNITRLKKEPSATPRVPSLVDPVV